MLNKMSNKRLGIIILGILLVIFLVLITIYLLGINRISSIEKKEINNKRYLINYIENIDTNSKNIDKYILFTLDYFYNEEDKKEITIKEIHSFLKDNFINNIGEDDIRDIGITPIMASNNIVYNIEKDAFILIQPIEKEKIYYYKLSKIKRTSLKKYVVTYTKYEISNLNEMIDYYINSNKNIKLTEIRDYILGNSKLSNIKKILFDNEQDIDKYAKKSGKMTVTYIMKGEKLLIGKVK